MRIEHRTSCNPRAQMYIPHPAAATRFGVVAAPNGKIMVELPELLVATESRIDHTASLRPIHFITAWMRKEESLHYT